MYDTTIKNDGSIRLWDCIRQQWVRLAADEISDELMATLSRAERAAIEALRNGANSAQARLVLAGRARYIAGVYGLSWRGVGRNADIQRARAEAIAQKDARARHQIPERVRVMDLLTGETF